VYCVIDYNISPSTNIINIFKKWLHGVDKKDKGRIHIGILALCCYSFSYAPYSFYSDSLVSSLVLLINESTAAAF
jgi:hypothetical protein